MCKSRIGRYISIHLGLAMHDVAIIVSCPQAHCLKGWPTQITLPTLVRRPDEICENILMPNLDKFPTYQVCAYMTTQHFGELSPKTMLL